MDRGRRPSAFVLEIGPPTISSRARADLGRLFDAPKATTAEPKEVRNGEGAR